MQPPLPSISTGLPPVSLPAMMGRPVPPPQWKSACMDVKSRNTAGTRSAHSPPTISQLGFCAHSKPGSSWHLDEQPSPSSALPSSQASSMIRPSPQYEVHEAPLQSGSDWQLAEQPSSGMALPSSQPSAPSSTLSPQ